MISFNSEGNGNKVILLLKHTAKVQKILRFVKCPGLLCQYAAILILLNQACRSVVVVEGEVV